MSVARKKTSAIVQYNQWMFGIFSMAFPGSLNRWVIIWYLPPIKGTTKQLLIFVVFSCDSDPSTGRFFGCQVHNLCKGYVPLGEMTAGFDQVRIRKRCKEIHSFFKWNLGDVAVCDVMFVLICFKYVSILFVSVSAEHPIWYIDWIGIAQNEILLSSKMQLPLPSISIARPIDLQLKSVTRERGFYRLRRNSQLLGMPFASVEFSLDLEDLRDLFLGTKKEWFSHMFFFSKKHGKSERKKY